MAGLWVWCHQTDKGSKLRHREFVKDFYWRYILGLIGQTELYLHSHALPHNPQTSFCCLFQYIETGW